MLIYSAGRESYKTVYNTECMFHVAFLFTEACVNKTLKYKKPSNIQNDSEMHFKANQYFASRESVSKFHSDLEYFRTAAETSVLA